MLVCCANSLGVRRGGGVVGANEDEFLGMRKLSLALPASSKKKKKIGSQQLTTPSCPTLFQYGLENWLSRKLQLEQYETFSVFFSRTD